MWNTEVSFVMMYSCDCYYHVYSSGRQRICDLLDEIEAQKVTLK